MDDYALKRLQREARARHEGRSRVGLPNRSSTCELCGQGDVRWGSMCQDCRARLLGGDPTPQVDPSHELNRLPRTPRRRRRQPGSVITPTTPLPASAPSDQRAPGMSLINNVPGAIYRCLTDSARTVVFVTHQIRTMTGRDPSEFPPGKSNLSSLVHADDAARVAAEFAAALGGAPFEAEYRVVHADESVRWVHDRAQLVVDEAGHRFMDGVLMDVTERRTAQEEMAWLALHDPLTRLPNRRAFDEQMAIERDAVSDDRPLSAAIFDIDHFKKINDEHGHDTGDQALIEVAQRLECALHDAGMVARTGGEEFVALLPGHSLAQAVVVAELARRAVECEPVAGLSVTISGGVATLASGDDMVGNADTALYRAKHEGRNRVATFP